MKSFTGFPKKDFRQRMISHWMKEGVFDTEQAAIDNYGGAKFDALCEKCDGTTLLSFNFDHESTTECFESEDDNFVIPVSAIDVYSDEIPIGSTWDERGSVPPENW